MRRRVRLSVIAGLVVAAVGVSNAGALSGSSGGSEALAVAAVSDTTEPEIEAAFYPAYLAYAVSMSPAVGQVARSAGFLQGLGGVWLAGGDAPVRSGVPSGANADVIFDG